MKLIIIGLAIVLVSLCPMMTAQAETLEGLRQKSGSPFVVYEEQTTNGRGAFKVYLPGVGGDRTVDMSRGYIVKPVGLPMSLHSSVGTTPTISIHPGFNLIASPTAIATDAVSAIKELGLSALIRLNPSGKFEASLENGPNFQIEQGRGYLAIQRQFTRGKGLIWTEEVDFETWHLKRSDELQSGQWTIPTTFGPFSSFDVDATFTWEGEKVVFSSRNGCSLTVGTFEIQEDGHGLKRLTGTFNGFCQSGDRRESYPNLSGSLILEKGQSFFPGSTTAIGSYPSPRGPDYTDPIFITHDFNEKSPIFSRDGQRIYFLADWDGALKPYSVPSWIPLPVYERDNRYDLATKLSKNLISTADGLSVAPDGSLIWTYFGDIWCRRPDGVEVNLTKTRGIEEREASFSPDGSRICYVRANAGGRFTQLWQMEQDGTLQRQIHDRRPNQFSVTHPWKP